MALIAYLDFPTTSWLPTTPHPPPHMNAYGIGYVSEENSKISGN